jgi:hypothetical protein
MATVTGLTAERMIAMENATVVSGNVVGNNLILVTKDGTQIVAGNVQGPVGPAGGAFIICTSTTRPTLTPADQGKAIYETDTKLVRIWNGTRYRVQEKIICTSATRPAMVAADEGTKIYETDTDLEFSWTGTSWLLANSYVARYADNAARSAAWPSPPLGAVSYLNNSPGILWMFETGGWISVGPAPGTMSPSILTVAPLNHVLMYGQTIANAQTLYPMLWSLVDPTFKQGSSLVVPDLRSRIPVGKDDMGGITSGRITAPASGLNSLIIGSTGGHQLTQTHNHSTAQHNHTPNAIAQFLIHGGTSLINLQTGAGYSPGIVADTSGAPVTVNNFIGGNSENIQPSIILNWILKIL